MTIDNSLDTRSATISAESGTAAVPEPPSLADLQDRAAINDLISRLGVYLDEHRFDELRSLFVEDASVHTQGGLATGRDAVVAQATRNHGEYEHLQHTIANVLIDLAGDRAEARANMVAGLVREGLRPEVVFGGVYTFGLLRTAGGWRFARLAARQVWRNEEPAAPRPAAS